MREWIENGVRLWNGEGPRICGDSLKKRSMDLRNLDPQRDEMLLKLYEELIPSVPPGMYLVPSYTSLDVWEGVVFVRSGFYEHGVFKFTLRIPKDSLHTSPSIHFNTFIFHPLVGDKAGTLDLSPRFPEWKGAEHGILNVLDYIQECLVNVKIWNSSHCPNKKAFDLFQSNRSQFQLKCRNCVELSLNSMYSNSPDEAIKFTKPRDEHKDIRDKVFKPRFKLFLDQDRDPITS